MKNLLLFTLAAALFVTSCAKKPIDDPDPVPNPTAVILQTHYQVALNESPGFFSNSKNTTSIKWDFGDGTTSNETSPVKLYTKAGFYNVKLTVNGQAGTSPTAALTKICVGTRQLDSLKLIKFPLTKNNDGVTAWHTNGTNPDIDVLYDLTSKKPAYQNKLTSPIVNANPNFTYTIVPGAVTDIARDKWDFQIMDRYNGMNADMKTWTVDMDSVNAAVLPIKLGAKDGYNFEVYWHMK